MSGITRCPGCATAFRVSSAQLDARDGQVRCGRCARVFDARTFLLDNGPTPAEKEFAAAVEKEMVAQVPAAPIRPKPAPKPSPARALEFGPRPRKRVSKAWWWASGAALIVGLLQLSFYYRSELLLSFPSAKPLVASVCAQLGCRIPLPRRIELVTIESSDLQADGTNPSVMVLSATIRNRAAFAQAWPALELTLTNEQDLALARRVLGPADYVPSGTSTEPGFLPNTEVGVKLYFETAQLKPTGYRVYLFYP
jgi:predicted Zn finger-like uncharacterized protein